MRGIPTIDCWVSLNPGGRGRLVDRMAQEGLLRDKESTTYHHPAQHHFKDAPERLEKGATIEEIIALMDEVGVERALVSIDVENPESALKAVLSHPDRFFAEVALNPFGGMEVIRKLENLVRSHPDQIKGARVAGFQIQKPYNNKIYYPLYAKCIELDIPVIAHVGIPGPRVPGESQNPMALDEVCWFFPELKVVMCHGGEPWEFLCVKLMLKWPNLYYSTSAFAPKHYPKAIIDYANTRGAEKILYAGYYPALDYRRIKRELEQDVPFRDHVWPLFLRENAKRVFKLK